MDFTIHIDDQLVEELGQDSIEHQLATFAQRLKLKAMADELLDDLKHIDLVNDPAWQLARELAWLERGNQYVRQ